VSLKFFRKERLKSRKVIGSLFKEKRSVGAFPIRFFYTNTIEGFTLQSAFSVSKKHFKKAVDRNRLKRLMRECLRLNKDRLISYLDEKELKISGMWVYLGNEIIDYPQMNKAVIKSIDKLITELSNPQND
jgi:ribonuclease P protein component